MSNQVLKDLTPQQLAELKAKAQKKLHERNNQAKKATSGAGATSSASAGGKKATNNETEILNKALIRASVSQRVAGAKQRAKSDIYKAKKEKKAIKTEIIEDTRSQLARRYNKLKAEKDGYKEANKLKMKYAKKMLDLETEVAEHKDRLSEPLERYIELVALEEVEKKERNRKIKFVLKTIFTFGWYARSYAKKEEKLENGDF